MPRRDFTKVPFAATGDVTSIPTAVQPDGSVSMTTGYGFDYQRDNGAGGGTPDPLAKSIPRDATNGILNEITASIGEIQLNGLAIWAASAAPYPINATVRHNNTNWRSTVANNSAQPGVAPLANWFDTTAQIVQATESVAGIVMLSNALNGSAQDKASTENAVGQKLTAAIALGATDLNTLSTRSDVGVYFQTSTGAATTALNYPVLAAGTLLVTPSAIAVQQEYTTRAGQKFVRGQETTTLWGDWNRVDSDQATESVAGVARISSSAQALAGSDDTTIMTPRKVASRIATETSIGQSSIASLVVALQGTNDASIITPNKLAAVLSAWFPNKVFAANDYIRIPDKPGGLIIQWGKTATLTDYSFVTVTLPTPFPSARMVFGGTNAETIEIGSSSAECNINLVTASTVRIGYNSTIQTSSSVVNWVAIGN